MTKYIPQIFLPGYGLPDGSKLNAAIESYPQYTSEDTVTATAGGGQANARLLTAVMNNIAVVASANDSVKLPPAVAGSNAPIYPMLVCMVNNGANSCQVFGSGTDTINGVASGTGVALAATKSALFFVVTTGQWFRILSA